MSDPTKKKNIISHVTKAVGLVVAPTLKSMSGQSVTREITCNNNGIYKSKINDLPLPTILKEYLKTVANTTVNQAVFNRFEQWLQDQNKPKSQLNDFSIAKRARMETRI